MYFKFFGAWQLKYFRLHLVTTARWSSGYCISYGISEIFSGACCQHSSKQATCKQFSQNPNLYCSDNFTYVWQQRRNLGEGRGANASPVFFLPQNSFFFWLPNWKQANRRNRVRVWGKGARILRTGSNHSSSCF